MGRHDFCENSQPVPVDGRREEKVPFLSKFNQESLIIISFRYSPSRMLEAAVLAVLVVVVVKVVDFRDLYRLPPGTGPEWRQGKRHLWLAKCCAVHYLNLLDFLKQAKSGWPGPR